MPAIEIRLLGGVDVLRDGVPDVNAGYPRQRMVLAALAVDVGRPLRPHVLMDRIWNPAPPDSAANSVQSHISRLRKLLRGVESVKIDFRHGGYVLDADPQIVDLHRSRSLIARARATQDDAAASRRYGRAFDLWRGEPFAGFGTAWFDEVRENLAAELHRAKLEYNDVLLRLGRHDELVTALPGEVRHRPFDERLVGQLMLALFQAGRQADALEHYARLRNRLVEDLGNEPGPHVREMHRRIVIGDASVRRPADATPTPRQLPDTPRLFTGRDNELGRLDTGYDTDRAGVWVISGPGGIGKTWLALHWANRRLDRFPDGQLYVNLHGFDRTEEPMSPGTALTLALDALGVPATAIPADIEARAARYRSLLADKRMLVLLDNARDAEQVLPLLPGGRDCATVITSRRDLPGLATAHGAKALRLNTLDEDQSRQTLARHLGEQRLAEQPAAVTELIAGCAGLPLALGILGARAATHDAFPLAAVAEELRNHADRLDVLDSGELDVSIRAVVDGSYRALVRDEARLFALLGLVDWRDIGLHAVASLAGLSLGRTRVLLRGLETANLVEQYVPGRYRMHDLTRLYAVEQAVPDRVALRRLVIHYRRTATRMDEHCVPSRNRTGHEHGESIDGCPPVPLADRRESRRWLHTERASIPLVQDIALANGWYEEAWRLAWSSTVVLWDLNFADDALAVCRNALKASELLGDPDVDAKVRFYLGRSLVRAGLPLDGVRSLKRSLRHYEVVDDRGKQSVVLRELSRCHERTRDFDEALACSQRALQLSETVSDPRERGRAFNAVGWYHALTGNYGQARVHCEEALRLLQVQAIASPATTDALHSLGYIAAQCGHHTEAIDYYSRALEALEEGWSEDVRPEILERLGDSHHTVGAQPAAHGAWRRALEMFTAQHRLDEADAVATKLAALTIGDVGRGVR